MAPMQMPGYDEPASPLGGACMKPTADGKGRLSLAARRRIFVATLATLVATAAGTWAGARGQTTAPHSGPVTAADKDAAAAQFLKAKDLYNQGRYAEARTENDKALALDPTSINAALLRRVLQDRLAPAPSVTQSPAAPTDTPAIATATQPKLPVLSPWQISMLRLGEFSTKETPRGRFDRKSLEDFWREVIMNDPQVQDKSNQAMNNFMNANNFQNQL